MVVERKIRSTDQPGCYVPVPDPQEGPGAVVWLVQLLGGRTGFAQPKIRSTQKSIWINLFAQLNPGPEGIITQTCSLRQPNVKPAQMELEALLASAATSFPCSTSTAKATSASSSSSSLLMFFRWHFCRGVSGRLLCCGLGWKIPSVMRVDVPAVERVFHSMTKILNYFIRSTQRHPIII